ncbi:MAG TPA: hypothetical protein VMT43_05910 [Acidimicrobiales bacterium]|nr:hypothetical protein [Acidimicrobiales bacterium]
MAAPEYVPHSPVDKPRVYTSPPWSGEQWVADRPGELTGRQPLGPRLGYPGPDQGFVLKLARSFEPRLVLTEDESVDDAVAGAAAVALKRASLFGRAPVVHDLTAAFTIWGFLSEADGELVRLRRPLFEEVSHPHHYMELRRIADLVPQAVLRLGHQEIARVAASDWRAFFKRKT